MKTKLDQLLSFGSLCTEPVFGLQIYNLHRSPHFWNEPEKFNPERFLEEKASEIDGWAGFDPARSKGALYPNEVCTCCLLTHLLIFYKDFFGLPGSHAFF
jgi:hypothetical protein